MAIAIQTKYITVTISIAAILAFANAINIIISNHGSIAKKDLTLDIAFFCAMIQKNYKILLINSIL